MRLGGAVEMSLGHFGSCIPQANTVLCMHASGPLKPLHAAAADSSASLPGQERRDVCGQRAMAS